LGGLGGSPVPALETLRRDAKTFGVGIDALSRHRERIRCIRSIRLIRLVRPFLMLGAPHRSLRRGSGRFRLIAVPDPRFVIRKDAGHFSERPRI